MIEAGLLYSGDDIPVPYDRFRDRVMFPITDVRGGHRVRRPRPGKGRQRKIPELAGNPAVSQGRQSLQPRIRAACRP
jgi:DNA primase (bacterial type)